MNLSVFMVTPRSSLKLLFLNQDQLWEKIPAFLAEPSNELVLYRCYCNQILNPLLCHKSNSSLLVDSSWWVLMQMMMSWFILPGGLSKALSNFCLLLIPIWFFLSIMQGGLHKKFLNRTSLNNIKIENSR